MYLIMYLKATTRQSIDYINQNNVWVDAKRKCMSLAVRGEDNLSS